MTAATLTPATLQSAAVSGTGSTISASSLLQQIFGAIATDPMSALPGGLGGSSGGAGGDYLSTVFMYINMGLISSMISCLSIVISSHIGFVYYEWFSPVTGLVLRRFFFINGFDLLWLCESACSLRVPARRLFLCGWKTRR